MGFVKKKVPLIPPALSDARIRQRLLSYLKPHWKIVLIGVICAVLTGLLGLALIYLLQDVFDALGKKDGGHYLDLVCVAVIGIYILRGIFSFGQNVSFSEVSQRIGVRVRNDIYVHLQSLSLSYFDRQRTGNLMSTMTNDVPVLQTGIISVKDVISGAVLAIGGTFIIFRISWKLSLMVLVVMPLMVWAITGITRKLRAITLATQQKLADVTTMMEETLAGIRLVRSFVAEKREIARFSVEIHSAKDFTMRGIRRSAALSPTTDLIGAVGIAIALFIGGHEVISGALPLKHLIGFVAAIDRIRVGVGGMGTIQASWRQAQGAAERIFGNVLDVPTEVVESPSAKPLPHVVGEVLFDRVSFGYYPDRPVLKDISFTMKPGEVVAVVGYSGAGKSTLSDLIPRFYDPTDGAILIDGCDIRDVTLDSLRRQIGIVPQDTILFGGTVWENIAYGMPDATMEQIEDAARHANAYDFIVSEMPNGFETIVGERGVKLSGGQRQRIAIARALLKNPRILILDEATSSLDVKSEILVQEALEVLMRGRTTLVISHRMSAIQDADRIIVLSAGRIIEEGTHQELVRLGGTYKELYENQFREASDTWPLLP
jgi:subfamily B ATP-binding cassette protein MsbA